MQIIQVDQRSINQLALLADEIWHEYFPCILSSKQIDYMVEKFQSANAMVKQIEDGYLYYFVEDDNEKCGYFCIQKQDGRLFLSKLYIKKEARGRKFATAVMNFIVEFCKENNLRSIYLHVNKYNKLSIDVYRHFDFEITSSDIGDIGNGYVMDDYIMTKAIK